MNPNNDTLGRKGGPSARTAVSEPAYSVSSTRWWRRAATGPGSGEREPASPVRAKSGRVILEGMLAPEPFRQSTPPPARLRTFAGH